MNFVTFNVLIDFCCLLSPSQHVHLPGFCCSCLSSVRAAAKLSPLAPAVGQDTAVPTGRAASSRTRHRAPRPEHQSPDTSAQSHRVFQSLEITPGLYSRHREPLTDRIDSPTSIQHSTATNGTGAAAHHESQWTSQCTRSRC